MTTKKMLGAGAVALLAGLATLALWPHGADATPRPDAAATPLAVTGERAEANAPSPDDAAPRQALAPTGPTALPGTGTVLAHLTFADDHAPAVGRIATLLPLGAEPRFDGRRQPADDAGTATFANVAPGTYTCAGKTVEVTAGQTVEVAYEYPRGLTLTGLVVDIRHRPVAGATIEVTQHLRSGRFPSALATSGPDGRFAVRAAPAECLVGARAQGFTASAVRFVLGKEGNSAEVELVLGDGGGSLEGTVVDRDGHPVSGAVVVVGNGVLTDIGEIERIPPFAALTRTDAEGHFTATGLVAGEQPVRVRQGQLAPWTGTCSITPGTTSTLAVVLETGAMLRGTVRDAVGAPVGDATISIGTENTELRDFATRADKDGAFELRGLPAGDLPLRVWQREAGRCETTVHTDPASPATCDLRLSRGLELRVRTVDAQGQPVAGTCVQCSARGNNTMWTTPSATDAHGITTACCCPDDATLTILARADGYEPLRLEGIDPHQGEIELRLQHAVPAARIVGRIVGPDGSPVANAMVSAVLDRKASNAPLNNSSVASTDNDGRFEIDGVPPVRCHVDVSAGDLADFESELHEVAAGATCDVGTIALSHGGRAIVCASGAVPTPDELRVWTADWVRVWDVGEQTGRLCSRHLAPGNYTICVTGDHLAAQVVPFAIRDGEDTVVDVALTPGTAQPLALVLPVAPAARWIPIAIRRAPEGEPVARFWIRSSPDGAPLSAKTCLLPGRYELAVELGDRTLRARFTVGATPAPPIRLELR